MICKHCKIEMEHGLVLDDGTEENGLGRTVHITVKNMAEALQMCWKCPACGHSERLNESR
jgi:hypothetical protein